MKEWEQNLKALKSEAESPELVYLELIPPFEKAFSKVDSGRSCAEKQRAKASCLRFTISLGFQS